jgi:hypothetical protein
LDKFLDVVRDDALHLGVHLLLGELLDESVTDFFEFLSHFPIETGTLLIDVLLGWELLVDESIFILFFSSPEILLQLLVFGFHLLDLGVAFFKFLLVLSLEILCTPRGQESLQF